MNQASTKVAFESEYQNGIPPNETCHNILLDVLCCSGSPDPADGQRVGKNLSCAVEI